MIKIGGEAGCVMGISTGEFDFIEVKVTRDITRSARDLCGETEIKSKALSLLRSLWFFGFQSSHEQCYELRLLATLLIFMGGP